MTWNEGFVSRRCGEGVLGFVFRDAVLTSVTWNEGFVSRRCVVECVSGCCADLCDME